MFAVRGFIAPLGAYGSSFHSCVVIICECVKYDSTSTYCTEFSPAARIYMQKLKIIQFGSQVECDAMNWKYLNNTNCFKDEPRSHSYLWLVLYRIIECGLFLIKKNVFILLNSVLLQYKTAVFYFCILYSCDAKLHFNNHYYSLQSHLILQKSF